MHKLAVGLSILSTLLLGAACSDHEGWADEATMGTASFALQNGIYSLHAVIDINTSPGGMTVVDSAETLPGDATLEVKLFPGVYAAELVSWELRRAGVVIGTKMMPEQVTSTGFSPPQFTIEQLGTVSIGIGFQIGTYQSVTAPLPP